MDSKPNSLMKKNGFPKQNASKSLAVVTNIRKEMWNIINWCFIMIRTNVGKVKSPQEHYAL